MPDAIVTALNQPGFFWLVFGAVLSGFVRGFSGFGSALVFLPIAGQFLPPVWVLLTLTVMDIIGPVPNLPRAWRDGNPPMVGWLSLGMLMALPFGLMILYTINPIHFRYVTSIIAIIVPFLLVIGFRYRGALSRPLLLGTGVVSGFLGSAAGLPGPPVILLFLSTTIGAARMRANILMYLLVFDLAFIVLLSLQGQTQLAPVMIGALLIIPAMVGNMIGAAIFRPDKEKIYRAMGYLIIITTALIGLPLWD